MVAFIQEDLTTLWAYNCDKMHFGKQLGVASVCGFMTAILLFGVFLQAGMFCLFIFDLATEGLTSGLVTCKLHLTGLNVDEQYMFFAAAYYAA